MFIALALQLVVTASATAPITYSGARHELEVRAPSFAAEATIDGELAEPQWKGAAVLNDFSMYQPVDGRAAPDSTEVLIWHSATALYVGIRAFEPHAAVRATLADRDKISGDDNIQIFLDTFNDHRRAFVFSVNPLGVQGDGIRSEGSGAGLASGVPGQTDLSPDFIFESKGHVTAWGYQVEIRIPFSAVRYSTSAVQDWGINIERTVQHSGYVETWTPARRASASFLSESGVLRGMTGLHRQRVLEVNPEITARATGDSAPPLIVGGRDASRGTWHYSPASQLGGNIKWDVNSALTLNGTVRPDFSQVEADAIQLGSDPRFALYYPEKRPFFTDGIEQFDVPNRLVYTRRIVQPVGAVKLTGTIAGTDVAVLSALDDRLASYSGREQPRFNIVRLRRDLVENATAGLLFTDRVDGANANRVVSGDLHIVFGGLYYAQFQAAASRTDTAGKSQSAPLWEGIVDRTGRSFGFHYSLTGIGDDFRAASGFVARTGFVDVHASNRGTIYGRPGARIENYIVRLHLDGLWSYKDFFRGASVLEDYATWENVVTLRGGWAITVAPTLSTYAFDPRSYVNYATAAAANGDTMPFRVANRLNAGVLRTSITTPQFQHLIATFSAADGSDVDFLETDPVRRSDVSGLLDWTPTQQLRVHGSYVASTLTRRSDGERVFNARIPRLAVEYQVVRPLFVRVVSQYDAYHRSQLRDFRTGLPLLRATGDGYALVTAVNSNALQVDGLIAYQPSPGTVVFLGYGNDLREREPLAFTRLRRVHDQLFAKLSYVFR